ncbi:MAG: NUDIX hydrolase [Bacteroidota bacterium]
MKRLFLKTIGRWILSDWFAHRFPVSVKGIVSIDGRVVLLKNERGEWDLPGGKLGRNEVIEQALQREIQEELGIDVQVGKLLSTFRASLKQQLNVLLVVYECSTDAKWTDLKMSPESFALALFYPEEVAALPLAQAQFLTLINQTLSVTPAK